MMMALVMRMTMFASATSSTLYVGWWFHQICANNGDEDEDGNNCLNLVSQVALWLIMTMVMRVKMLMVVSTTLSTLSRVLVRSWCWLGKYIFLKSPLLRWRCHPWVESPWCPDKNNWCYISFDYKITFWSTETFLLQNWTWRAARTERIHCDLWYFANLENVIQAEKKLKERKLAEGVRK